MIKEKILFIGGGNMTRAMITGLLMHGFAAENIYVVDRNQDKRDFLSNTFKVHISENPHDFLSIANVVILSIKPQGAHDACTAFNDNLKKYAPLVISVMAGVTVGKLNEWLGGHLAIVRAAPNTPAMIQEGVTGLFANSQTTQIQRGIVEKIIGSMGIFAWVTEEKIMNAITALSGSGPAYYFYFMEIMQEIAITLGIPSQIAKNFAIQTGYGATKLALESGEDLAKLRAQVTSKKGTTEAALSVMKKRGLPLVFHDALTAAYDRALELSDPTSSKS